MSTKQMGDTNNKPANVITVNAYWAFSIFAAALIGAAGTGAYAYIRFANTAPFRINAMETQILEMRDNFMPLDLSTEKWKNNDREHAQVMTKLDKIDVKMDRLLEK